MGDSLSSSQHPDVFVSSDGGYSWRGTLRGPHHYSILDSGGLLVAVEASHDGLVKTIKYWADIFTLCAAYGSFYKIYQNWLLKFYHFFPPDSQQTRASAGSRITSLSSRSSSQAWHLSQGPRQWVSVCWASGLRKTVSPCGWPSPLISRVLLPDCVRELQLCLLPHLSCAFTVPTCFSSELRLFHII